MRTAPLRRLAVVTYGLGQPPPVTDDGVPIVRATNIERGRIIARGMIYAALEDLPLDRCPRLHAGEILVVRSGAYTGDSALVTPEWNGAAPGYDLRVTPCEASEARFLAYALLGRPALEAMSGASSRAAQPHLNAEELGDVPISDLPRERQRAIAGFLDTETARIDALIAKKQRLIELIEERRWTSFLTRVETTQAPRVPLRRALNFITDGPFGSAFTSKEYSDSGIGVVRLGNIGFAEFRTSDLAHLRSDRLREFTRYQVHEGDVLFAGLGDERNHAGRACVTPDIGPAIVKGKCFCARLDLDRADPDYVSLFFSSPLGAESVAVEARGSTRSMINLAIVKSVALPLPSAHVQT